MQTPTRSLWIGNLDSSVTSEQLIHVFAPYGAIESLRLLPEKECGFVNFVDQADAIRAKEDVLNRLGGDVGMPNGQTVRIGFGKADSAPVAPAKVTNMNSPSATSPGGGLGKATGNNVGLAGMDAQLQSTPTRALWIGSIPSTTTPATILSVFSPYGPIESARVLTHKNCGFSKVSSVVCVHEVVREVDVGAPVNFERLDDAVRARKALNGRDGLGSDVGAIRIDFAKVPVKNGSEGTGGQDEGNGLNVQGVGDLSVGATIHALRNIKGATTIPVDQQVLSGEVENYRSNLSLSMIASGAHAGMFDSAGKPAGWTTAVTEQQMVMKELSGGSPDAEADVQALAEFRPPMMYYTTIPLVSERPHNRRWDASKLRELRKRLDTSTISTEEVDNTAADFLDGEIVDLASDWLGNTLCLPSDVRHRSDKCLYVVQKLFEKCSPTPRLAMLERLSRHLAMIGIHKNGTWAAQKIIECVQTADEVALVTQNLRPYVPPLLLDQFGNYVMCLRFGAPATDFLFDAMADRLWEIAQGRFGARSMRACLESSNITVSQQRRIATAIILNSIPLATNPNDALLLTWLLDTSNFPSRYNLLAPRFTPHLSHLCTHKLASLTVLRIVNQKVEPEASTQIVEALFSSPGDHVLTDVLGDQVNGVAVVHKILTSPFVDPTQRPSYVEATKRVLIELKVGALSCVRQKVSRARELEAEQGIGARHRPPALRALASGGSPPNNDLSSSMNSPGDNGDLPPTNYPAGFRRARAGTLPSNVQLAAQRFAAASSTLSSSTAAAAATASTGSFQEQLQRQSFAPPASTAPVRPGLRHSASVASSAASSALTERDSRLRSGSLTLPSGGLSNAFGSSLFSSTWMPSRNGGMPVLDDLRSVTSMDSGADDFDVHTLDYLGLDETLRHPPAATISELRNQAQAAIAGNLAANPSRLRATTVSNPYRPSAGASLLATPSAEEEEELYDERMYGRQSLNAYQDTESDYLSAAYVAKGFKQSDHLSVGLGDE
ncbi:uncharacterized protein B0H18DRAFT_1126348 [Fomitopsis serialis]|uniref:uncharacterized protein n=1 Tax=Fomitopsis serialis TaxID=139415 RepID=UPI0020076A09|nr:uncharacterized protein B0H18DRAFT_1126348 [Neoantrodia serialis]KAH9913374.1 hypothetical protein B0H18DRAFT_1126348 [Neoantrodia serialis]